MSTDWTHEPAESWMALGICAQVDGELFFPTKGAHVAVRWAKWICHHCPVLEQCAAYSLERTEIDGVWGAMTMRERRAERSRRAS
jgi:WhiB family redox-sensing transcriptional regulator